MTVSHKPETFLFNVFIFLPQFLQYTVIIEIWMSPHYLSFFFLSLPILFSFHVFSPLHVSISLLLCVCLYVFITFWFCLYFLDFFCLCLYFSDFSLSLPSSFLPPYLSLSLLLCVWVSRCLSIFFFCIGFSNTFLLCYHYRPRNLFL